MQHMILPMTLIVALIGGVTLSQLNHDTSQHSARVASIGQCFKLGVGCGG